MEVAEGNGVSAGSELAHGDVFSLHWSRPDEEQEEKLERHLAE